MAVYNLTPHAIEVFTERGFINLEQTNPTTWVADGTLESEVLATYDSCGVARISTDTVSLAPLMGRIPVVKTTYGDAVGIPDNVYEDDILIVSLPMQSMAKTSGHPLAHQMVSPYKVVRLRANGSVVLGCMGFTL